MNSEKFIEKYGLGIIREIEDIPSLSNEQRELVNKKLKITITNNDGNQIILQDEGYIPFTFELEGVKITHCIETYWIYKYLALTIVEHETIL